MRVLIIGGGPAGATTAGVLAQSNVDVTLIERDRHPRHHVGESLQPATCGWLKEHLGLEIKGFPRKYGAVYVWGQSREPWSVLFDARLEQDLASMAA